MRTRLKAPLRVAVAWMLGTGLCPGGGACAEQVSYDDDTELDFVWTAPDGSFDHYNIYSSVDGGEYRLDGSSLTEAYKVSAQNGHTYKVKVAAVTSGGTEGPFSPESDPVICDTVPPLLPTLSTTYDVLDESTIVLSLRSGPTDANFSNYQLRGGQYIYWTDTSETTTFVFIVDPDSANVLSVREKDLAGNVGPAASLTVENLSGDNDSDGIPNFYEYMYREILDAENPADASVDSDGDGWSNYEEFLAGTDPTRPESAPADTIPPTIVCLTRNTSAARGGTVTVEATLQDNLGVTEAWLYYKGASAATWVSLNFLSGSANIRIPDSSAEDICYFVTADDAAGNGPVGDPSDDGSTYYTIRVLDAPQTLNLAEGWNLVGISGRPVDPSCSTLFGGVPIGSVWGWDGTKNVAVSSVEPLRAYWVLVMAPASIKYECLPLSNTTPDLSHPWNMFAVAQETPLPLTCGNVVGSVWGWDGTKYVRVEGSLKPGIGYWVATQTVSKTAGTAPSVGSESRSGSDTIFALRLNMELSGVDKGALELALSEAGGPEILDPAPPPSPDGFSCYIVGGRSSPFDRLSKKGSVLASGDERSYWVIVAQLSLTQKFSLSWDNSAFPPNVIAIITELNVQDGTPKGGSLSMAETEKVACSAPPSTGLVFAWRIEATCRATSSQDANGNTIADDWEQHYFAQGACDPSADHDRDGMSNLSEFIAGTNPRNPYSVLFMSSIQKDSVGGNMVLTWQTVPGRKYQVVYCDSLEDGWLCLGTEIEGTGSAIDVSDDIRNPGLSKRFYSVRVW